MTLREPLLPPGEDPGDAWVDAVLEPLRRAEVRCDVAPAVMTRLIASRAAHRPAPSSIRRPGLIWAAWGFAASVAIAFLALPLVSLVRQGAIGMQQARILAGASGHITRPLMMQARMLVESAVTAMAPLLRATVTLLEAAAPIFKSAGALAALSGVLSILISLYIFTHARGTAPPSGARGSFLSHGGLR